MSLLSPFSDSHTTTAKLSKRRSQPGTPVAVEITRPANGFRAGNTSERDAAEPATLLFRLLHILPADDAAFLGEDTVLIPSCSFLARDYSTSPRYLGDALSSKRPLPLSLRDKRATRFPTVPRHEPVPRRAFDLYLQSPKKKPRTSVILANDEGRSVAVTSSYARLPFPTSYFPPINPMMAWPRPSLSLSP